jgi:ribonuclease J
VPGDTLIDMRELDNYPPEQVVLVSTGSQGEPMSALSRIAANDHHVVQIQPGDTVVLASSLIPGNENSVYRVINGLTRHGANVIHKGNALVHVSGHASAGELLYCYNIVKPRNVMPVHGEWRHLRANADLAIATGIPKKRTVIAEDGVVVDLVNGVAKIVGKVQAGYVYVDGLSVGDVTESSLKDRRILGEEGIVSVFVVVDSSTGKVVGGPDIQARGSGIEDAAFAPAVAKIEESLLRSANDGVVDVHQLQQLIRRAVGKWVSDTYRRRPMILPVVVEV